MRPYTRDLQNPTSRQGCWAFPDMLQVGQVSPNTPEANQAHFGPPTLCTSPQARRGGSNRMPLVAGCVPCRRLGDREQPAHPRDEPVGHGRDGDCLGHRHQQRGPTLPDTALSTNNLLRQPSCWAKQQVVAVNQQWSGHPGTLVREYYPAPGEDGPAAGTYAWAMPCTGAADSSQLGWSVDGPARRVKVQPTAADGQADSLVLCLEKAFDDAIALRPCGAPRTKTETDTASPPRRLAAAPPRPLRCLRYLAASLPRCLAAFAAALPRCLAAFAAAPPPPQPILPERACPKRKNDRRTFGLTRCQSRRESCEGAREQRRDGSRSPLPLSLCVVLIGRVAAAAAAQIARQPHSAL